MARRTFPAPRRQMLWSDIMTSLAAVGVVSAKVASGLSSTGISTSGATLIRTRGSATVHFDPTTIADTMQWAFGLGIFSSDAFSAGVASLPGPITDVDYDWVYYSTGVVGPVFSVTESGTDPTSNFRWEVDFKAMRIMKPNTSLGWVFEGLILSGGGTLDCGIAARHLFKLG